MRTLEGTKVCATPSVTYGEECALAGVNGSEGGFLHVRIDGLDYDETVGVDKAVVNWKVYGTDGELLGSGDDMRQPDMFGDKGLRAMGALISFLLACAESDSEESDNYTLFDRDVREWAECYSDELQMIALEIEEELGDL